MADEASDDGLPLAAKAKIRRLNDVLRTTGAGGRIVTTVGVDSLSMGEFAAIIAAVARFDAFTPDNDPHGEHDCALVHVAGHEVIWKIDCYDLALQYHSS